MGLSAQVYTVDAFKSVTPPQRDQPFTYSMSVNMLCHARLWEKYFVKAAAMQIYRDLDIIAWKTVNTFGARDMSISPIQLKPNLN